MTEQEAIEVLLILKGTGKISEEEIETIDVVDETEKMVERK